MAFRLDGRRSAMAASRDSTEAARFAAFVLGLAWAIGAWSIGASDARAGEDALARGDVVSIYIEDERSLDRPVTVDEAGAAAVAYVGRHPVAGLDAAAAADSIAGAIEVAGFIVGPRVTVVVEERAPYFIDGAVAEPGAYPFLPRLTVDRAIAIAGGYKRFDARETAIDPLRIAELQGRLEVASGRRAELSVGLDRLDALAAGRGFDPGSDDDATMGVIMANERSLFDSALQLRSTEKTAAAERLAIIDDEVDILELRRNALETLVAELAEQQKALDLLMERGISTRERLNASRADLLRARADLLGTDQAIARAERERHDLRAKLEESAFAFASTIAEERRRVLDALARERETIAVADSQLDMLGLGIGLASDADEPAFDVVIRRKGEAGRETVAATADTLLRRGDMVRVSPRPGGRSRVVVPAIQ